MYLLYLHKVVSCKSLVVGLSYLLLVGEVAIEVRQTSARASCLTRSESQGQEAVSIGSRAEGFRFKHLSNSAGLDRRWSVSRLPTNWRRPGLATGGLAIRQTGERSVRSVRGHRGSRIIAQRLFCGRRRCESKQPFFSIKPTLPVW
jgi:hypothetical protein